ncbi:SCP2 sterol-binding domain-containing protein [Nocardia sp. CA-135953]|uniref:SCP2 sterol-binding domain-containing protein n=1 Tax=Nocardia sp. CA-135953 TaxID=3239978 RepID=UPI003D97B1AB
MTTVRDPFQPHIVAVIAVRHALDLAGEGWTLIIGDGRATATPGELDNADATVTTDLHTLGRLGTRQLDPADVADRVHVAGETELALRLLGSVIGHR